MKHSACIPLLAVLLGTGTSVSAATDPVSPAALDAMRTFVLTDCEFGEQVSALDALREHGEPLVPELERLLAEGPDEVLFYDVTGALERRWEARQAFLETGPQLGLDPQALLDVTTMAREAFIERERRRFDLACREKAAVGLAGIGSPRAWRALRRVSEQADPILREMILSILERSRPAERGRAPLRSGRTRNYNN
jgi:hypothetical protein